MTHPYQSLIELLNTMPCSNYRDVLTRKITEAREAQDTDRVETLTRDLDSSPAIIEALDALAFNHEFSDLLLGWQWHTTRAALNAGATWQQIAMATGKTVDQACADFLSHAKQAKNYARRSIITEHHEIVLNPDTAHNDDHCGNLYTVEVSRA